MALRSIDTWLDRFAYRHPKFGIPHFINYLLAGSVIVFILDMFSNHAASAMLGLDFGSLVVGHEFWRLLTFPFVPDNSRPIWFVVGVFFYYFLGNTMEREWGTAKLTLFYLSGILLTFLASIVTFFWGGGAVSMPITIGAIHETLFLAFATLYPDAQLRVYFILPIKAKWLAVFYVFLEIWQIVSMNRIFLWLFLPLLLPPLIASWINYLIFFWTPVKAAVRRAFGRAKHQTSKQTINFKAAQKKAQETRGYLHKCEVCGKTNVSDPDMEFRYCSKCDGYHCYCMDHINNHVHIHEDSQ